jgi:hypothetical protein
MLGAVGVMQLANVDGVSLTDKRFAPVWKENDRRGLPVLVHPSAPAGDQTPRRHEVQPDRLGRLHVRYLARGEPHDLRRAFSTAIPT